MSNEMKSVLGGKKLLFPALIVASFVIAGLTFSPRVRAADENHWPPFVQALVEKFNLNADEVASTLEESRTQWQAQNQARHREDCQNRLEALVDEGKLTAEQRTAIEAKQAEMQGQRAQHQEEMQTWLAEQGIDPDLFPFGGFGGRGLGGPGHKGFRAPIEE